MMLFPRALSSTIRKPEDTTQTPDLARYIKKASVASSYDTLFQQDQSNLAETSSDYIRTALLFARSALYP